MRNELKTLNRWWQKHLLDQGVVKSSEQWSVGGPLFPDSYWTAGPRVLWVLKETGDKGYDVVGPDLPSFVRKRLRAICDDSNGTYHRVGLCTYGLVNRRAPLSEARDMVEEGLRHCAVINLKKTAGRGSCDSGKVKLFAKRTLGLWMTEIAMLAPDLVVAGGTFWWMVSPAGLDKDCCYYRKKASYVEVPLGVLCPFTQRPDQRVRIVEFLHPQRNAISKLWACVVRARRHLSGSR